MSEQQRTRLYAWLRDQTDEQLAEYLMACLAPAPLSDLVTKDHLDTVLSRFATKEDMHAGFAALRNELADLRAEFAALLTEHRAEFAALLSEHRADTAAQLAELRSEIAAQRSQDRAEFAAQLSEHRAETKAQRAEDRRAAQHRHYWLTGVVISAVVALGAPTWLDTLGIIG